MLFHLLDISHIQSRLLHLDKAFQAGVEAHTQVVLKVLDEYESLGDKDKKLMVLREMLMEQARAINLEHYVEGT